MPGTVFSDVITTNAIPDALRVIYSNELEFTSRPSLVFDQPSFVEPRGDFAAKRGEQVVWTIYHQLPPAIGKLSENQDVEGGSVTDHQVSFTVDEYGNAIGTTEKLDLTSYHGPISNIAKSLLAPNQALTMDTLCRNMFWNANNRSLMDSSLSGPEFRLFTGNVANRQSLNTTQSLMTADVARTAAHHLTIRRVPTMGGQSPSYICITHPSVTFDLRNDPFWKDAQLYAGATQIFNGEEGMIHGVRFLKSDRARLPNGGMVTHQTQLVSSYPSGVTSVVVTDASVFEPNDEVTLHNTGVSTTVGNVSWIAPDGQDPTNEEMIIKSVNTNTNTIVFTQKTGQSHAASDFVTEGFDVYPMVFLGGIAALGKGIVVPPEVRVSLPTDKLRRISYTGWYALLGYGVLRSWVYEIVETLASINTPPPFSF